MSGFIALLRDLHRVHRQKRDLREHLDRLPFQLKAQRARQTRAEAAVKDAQDALKKLKVGIHEREVSLKSKAQQIEKWETQINLVTSKKEYDALKLEMAHTKEECGRLEDEVLLAMTQTDERTAALPGLEKTMREVRDEVARFETEAREKQANLDQDMAKIEAQLKELEAQLPSDMRPNYDRMVKSLGADALAPVNDRICSSCSTGITAQQQTNLMMGKLVTCTSCGRILYLPE
jgi:predicted  nucleic acid-binding Zn-ribbon protein